MRNLSSERDVLRKKALKASNDAAQKMVKRELRRQPPSLYYKEESALVRIPISKKSVKGKKISLKNSCESRKRQAESEIHTETDQLRASLPKASRKESVLDASIHQVISGEKLNGDTINFYFHYLRENYACSEVNTVSLGRMYFYPSLERGDDEQKVH